MDERPRVSVVIPTFNCAAYIGGAIESIRLQDYGNLEVIVVDDCSTDETQLVVAAANVEVKYIRNPRNSGAGFSRNQGINAAEGKYVAFLDADDEWLEGKLIEQVEYLEANESVVIAGGEMLAWDEGGEVTQGRSSVRHVSVEDLIVKNWLKMPTVVARKEALLAIGGFREDLIISEDYDLWLRLAEIGVVAHFERPLVRFRARPDGLSAGNRHRTYRLDREYMLSLLAKYKNNPHLRRFVKRGISARALERAIEQCDESKEYAGAFARTMESLAYWPWTDPSMNGGSFLRMRRLRRIIINCIRGIAA